MQTTYNLNPAAALEGMLADAGNCEVITALAQAAIRMGIVVVKHNGDADDLCRPPPAVAASVNSIIVTGVSTAGQQIYAPAAGGGLDFDGTGIGGGDGIMSPVARNLRVVFDGHADWDVTTAVAAGYDEDGDYVTENFAVATSANLTGTVLFSRLISFTLPAQTGGGGTFTMGVGTLLGDLTGKHGLGVAALMTSRGQADTATGYDANEDVSIVRKGRVWVLAEEAVEPGDPVYVRMVAAGAEVLGRLRRTEDGTLGTAPDAALLRGARWVTTTAAAALGVIEINLPS